MPQRPPKTQRVRGHVLDVVTRRQGAVGQSWVGTALRVIDAHDLSRDGGTFTLDADPSRVYHFGGVTEGELETDPDLVTTVEAAPATLGADEVGEFPLTVWPEAVETFAEVQAYGQDDAVLVTVPHSLKTLLADGIRSPEARESVEIVLHGTEWVIADVIGRPGVVQPEAMPWLDADLAELRDRLTASADALARGIDTVAAAASAADQKAAAAQTSANGKNAVTTSTSAPTSGTPGTTVGDLWMQTSAGGTVIGQWTWTALGWVSRPVDSQAIANLDVGKLTAGSASISSIVATKLAADFGAYKVLTADKLVIDQAFAQSVAATIATFQTVWAGKITGDVIQADALNGKTIQGADIYTPSKASTPRIHLGGSVFEVVRKPDADSPEVQTVSLGGVSADQFTLSSADGTPGVTMDASGAASFSGDVMAGGDLFMKGSTDPLTTYLAKTYAQGHVTSGRLVTDSSHFGSGELGLLGLDAFLGGGSVYRISFGGYLRTASASTAQLTLRATKNNTSVAPTINSTAYNSWVFPVAAGTNSVSSSFLIVGDGSSYRFLLTGKSLSGNIETWAYGSTAFPFQLAIEHVGFDPSALNNGYRNDGGGTPFANAAPAAPATPTRVTYTKTYVASTVSFRAGGKVTDGTLQQGYYGGAQRYSYAVAPQAMLTDLAGSTVKSVEVQLANKTWFYGAGGTARLSIWGGALPTSQPAETGNVVQAVPNWAPGATKWVNLAGAGTVQNWAGGSYKGVVLGEGAGTNGLYYGKFGTAVTFRATYVK